MVKKIVKARRCADFSGKGKGKKCKRFKMVSVRTAKGKRQGKQFHQGDRIIQGSWQIGRWKKARKIDMKRRGAKYEGWERPKGRGRRIARMSWR